MKCATSNQLERQAFWENHSMEYFGTLPTDWALISPHRLPARGLEMAFKVCERKSCELTPSCPMARAREPEIAKPGTRSTKASTAIIMDFIIATKPPTPLRCSI
jgi:hypothetical protein